MVKCPQCGFDNEDGELFCEQCKTDLSSTAATPAEPEVPVAAILADPLQVANDPLPIVEAAPMDPLPVVSIDPIVPAPFPILGLDDPLPVAEAIPASPAADLPAAEAIPVAVVAEPAAATPAEPAVMTPAPAGKIAPGSQPRLKVMRGVKVGVEFPIYPEYNYIGRADEKPVDIDLEDQEPPDRVWCSRQHAVIHFDDAAGSIVLEDLNSSNGTYVNRNRVYPGEKKALNPNDVIQIGTVHMKLLV